MSGRKVPSVVEQNRRFRVTISQGASLEWWFTLRPEGLVCTVRINAPGSKEWTAVEPTRDK